MLNEHFGEVSRKSFVSLEIMIETPNHLKKSNDFEALYKNLDEVILKLYNDVFFVVN